MSCGQITLNAEKIKVDKYYAAEIYPQAIQITQKNYPNTIQLGNLLEVNESVLKELPKIDLVLFGFPCRNASKAVKGRQGYDDGLQGSHSWLFYPCADILDWVKTNNNKEVKFLCENVDGVSKEDREIISDRLGVEPIQIDSALVSAQDRKRLYWSNIEGVEIPEDRNINLEDIILKAEEVEDKYWYRQNFDFHGEDKKVCATLHLNGHDILKRVNNPKFKSATLTSCRGGNLQKKVYQDGRCRKLTPLEYERLQTVPDNYTEGVPDSHRYNMLGDGWNMETIRLFFKQLHKV